MTQQYCKCVYPSQCFHNLSICIQVQSVLSGTSGFKMLCCCKHFKQALWGLMITNPLKSNLTRHVAAHLLLMCFLLSWGCKEMSAGALLFCGIYLLSVVSGGSYTVCLSHTSCTESIPKERKVMQTRDSSKSSQMKSQGSHYASNILMQETRKSLTISVSKQLPSSQSLGECGVELCALCTPSATAPLGVGFI